jgi:spore coat polysaccharide biosynthesis protein SpsF
MRTIAIIQARMGSTRLPGKVLMDLGGDTVLAHGVQRLRRADRVDHVVVATTAGSRDDAIVSECSRLGAGFFRGSEADVLDRYYQAALAFHAGVVVRITSDCPLIDPGLVDEVVELRRREGADYASNCLLRRYPRGLDTEVFTVEALERTWRQADKAYQREHVTPYMVEHPERFKLASSVAPSDYSHYRWTVDTPQDLQLLREIYARFPGEAHFDWRAVIEVMEREPQLAEINSMIVQKALGGD